ncbi:unnamed protein product, partial [Heterotrigona itama]
LKFRLSDGKVDSAEITIPGIKFLESAATEPPRDKINILNAFLFDRSFFQRIKIISALFSSSVSRASRWRDIFAGNYQVRGCSLLRNTGKARHEAGHVTHSVFCEFLKHNNATDARNAINPFSSLVLWIPEHVSVGLKKFKNGDFNLFDGTKSERSVCSYFKSLSERRKIVTNDGDYIILTL